MAGEIVVVYAFLETLEHHARAVAAALDEASPLQRAEFPGNPEITAAYARFVDCWDGHRLELRESVAAAADAMRSIRESFQAAEAELVAALGPG